MHADEVQSAVINQVETETFIIISFLPWASDCCVGGDKGEGD